MKNTLPAGLLALTIIASSTAYSYGQGQHPTPDDVLKNADLVNIIGSAEVLNLRAQMSNPTASTRSVNDLDNFVAMTVPDSEPARTEFVEFDKNQKILQKATFGSPWMGVAHFTQSEIPPMSLQDGMDMMRSCLLKKKRPIKTPDEITSVVLYKTLNTNNVVYDFIFKNPATSQCHEYLYVPANKDCFTGHPVACHLDISDPISRNVKK